LRELKPTTVCCTHKEKDAMSQPQSKPQVKPIPDNMHTITPYLVCAGASEAIEFYKKAFNAVEHGRLAGQDGKLLNALIHIEGSAVMVMDDMPEWGSLDPRALKGSPVSIHIYVKDVDAAVAQAVEAGVKVTMPVADMFWGDRYAQLEDPFGHKWSVATHVRDLSPDEIRAGMLDMMTAMTTHHAPAA